jgi:hypothetical protein
MRLVSTPSLVPEHHPPPRRLSWIRLDSSDEPVLLCDRDGEVVLANAAALLALGRRPREVLDRPLDDLFYSETGSLAPQVESVASGRTRTAVAPVRMVGPPPGGASLVDQLEIHALATLDGPLAAVFLRPPC